MDFLKQIELELREHPGREPIKNPRGEPILDKDGNFILVPFIHDQQAIYLNGEHVGYCHVKPGMPISLLGYYHPAIVDAIKTFVESKLGGKSRVGMPPQPPPQEAWVDPNMPVLAEPEPVDVPDTDLEEDE